MSDLCRFADGALRIEIALGPLIFAAEQHPEFWNGRSPASVPNIVITDCDVFAAEVARTINEESEDGSTMLTRMLEAAIKSAVEMGCEGAELPGDDE